MDLLQCADFCLRRRALYSIRIHAYIGGGGDQASRPSGKKYIGDNAVSLIIHISLCCILINLSYNLLSMSSSVG